jgi:hypothetical protein
MKTPRIFGRPILGTPSVLVVAAQPGAKLAILALAVALFPARHSLARQTRSSVRHSAAIPSQPSSNSELSSFNGLGITNLAGRKPRQNGRPRLEGKRLPTLAQISANPAKQRATVRGWYGERERVVRLVWGTAAWYHSGMLPLPIRWVLVRDCQEEFDPPDLLCTDLTAEPVQILEWFVLRWRLRGDLVRSPCAFGPGDAPAMERIGHRPHHSGPAGAVVDGDAVGRTGGAEGRAAGQAGGMISQTPAELCGGNRRSAPACGDLAPFFRVTYDGRYGGNLAHFAGTLDRYSLLRGVNG